MKKLLFVVDMQNDFVRGSLGTNEAVEILENVVHKIKEYKNQGHDIAFTKDTHLDNYMDTSEGAKLPIKHCIKGSFGWEICDEIQAICDLNHYKIYEKYTFGSDELAKDLMNGKYDSYSEIELIGLCTDICVVSNALLIKTFLKETPIKVDSKCCAGTTPQSHRNALEVMNMCQVDIIL